MPGDPVAFHWPSTVEQEQEAERHSEARVGADDRLNETGRANQQGLGTDGQAERFFSG